MPFDKTQIDETKEAVLYELENMFTQMTHRFSSSENEEKLKFLLDIESGIKQRLMEIEPRMSAPAN